MFVYNTLNLTTKVINIEKQDDFYFVELENTPFYPESGGQLADKGYINDVTVLDVVKREKTILHKVASIVEGEVVCNVCEKTRYNHSLIHSAQHLLSAVFESDGIDTGSFYMRDDHFVIDLYTNIDRNTLDEYEKKINSYIIKGLKIFDRLYDEKLDSEIDVSYIDSPNIRLVIIDGLEKNPCGGTHVNSTSEIKYMKIVKFKASKDSTRITVFPGNHGIDYVNKYFNNYCDIINLVRQPEEEVYNLLEKKLKENKKMSKEIKKFERLVNNGKED